MRTSLPLLASFASLAFAVAARGAAEADLFVGYDASYVSANGGVANTQVIIANAVAGSNAVNDRSGTGARVRVVGYLQSAAANYKATSNGGFAGWMWNNDSRLADVVAAADTRGADLVTYICDSTDDGAAAVAYQPGRYSSFDASAFWSTVVAHELGGHNYGCDHKDGRENPKTVMLHNYCGGGAQGYFSNPNIWLNGVKLLGQGSCLGGTAGAGGDNAYLVGANAQGVADRYERIVAAPQLANVVRRWSFTQAAGAAPAGATITDSVTGTALATVQGAGATFTGKGLRLPGGASGAAYIKLPAGVLSAHTHVTLEIWATPLSVQNWARLFDFNNGEGNYIMLSLARGTDQNLQRFEHRTAAATVARDSSIPTVAGLANHYAITFANNGAGGGRWTWYRNGDEVGYLDVTSTLAAVQDVNAWLGRSAYGADAFAHCEYSEVRISNVALSRDQIFANYRLGPNWQGANVTLSGNDPVGQASFNSSGLWSDGQTPGAAKTYETYGFRLRTPADSLSRSFAGQSLRVTGGGIVYKGADSTTTFNALTLAGDNELVQAGSGTWNLAGNVAVASDAVMLRAANGPINVSANLSGAGSFLAVNNTVTLTGANSAFTGAILVGDGRFGGLSIDSEARLGANPPTFNADQLTLNRGILYNTATTTIDDANRGIRIGVSAGLFNVAPGTTLTLATPLSSPSSGDVLQTAPLYPNPVVGLFIKENSGTLVLTHPNNSHTGEILINGGAFTVSGAGRLNNGDQAMPVVNNGALTFGSTANQLVSGVISGAGSLTKSGSGMLTLSAANTFTGATTISGGTLRLTGSLAAGGSAGVADGAILTGTGTVGRALSFAAGAIHAPGNPAGAQTITGALSYANGSRLRWILPSNSNATNVANRVTAAAVTVAAGAVIDVVFNPVGGAVNFTNTFWTEPRSWTVLTSSTKTGAFSLGTVSADAGGRSLADYGSLSLQQDASSVTLIFTPTPDSPADVWRAEHFGVAWETLPAAADDADPDNDGVTNLFERAFAGDPNVADASIAPFADANAPLVSLVYRRSKAATDLVFTVLESPDLTDASWTTATGSETILEETDAIRRIRFTSPIGDAPKKFLRLQVTQP